jgi:23S rRNA (pseudouridine1915-N3)-methyltransferase
MAAQITFIWIGQLKNSVFVEPVALYWQRLQRYYRLREVCLKDASGRLPAKQRVEQESQAVLNALDDRDTPICLDHQGKALASTAFAQYLRSWLEEPNKRPCFIIGGAFGLSRQLKQRSRLVLSLGPLTFPHELARLILLEQVYRAATILHNHPYHN